MTATTTTVTTMTCLCCCCIAGTLVAIVVVVVPLFVIIAKNFNNKRANKIKIKIKIERADEQQLDDICNDYDPILCNIFQFLTAKELAIVQRVSWEWNCTSKQTAKTRLTLSEAVDNNKWRNILTALNINDTETISMLTEQFGICLLLYKLEIHEHLPQWAAAAAAAAAATGVISIQPSLFLSSSMPMSTLDSNSNNRRQRQHQRQRVQSFPVQFQPKPYYLKCPDIGRIIMRMLIHSTSNNALYKLNYDDKQFMPIEIIVPKKKHQHQHQYQHQHQHQHPFGTLQIIQVRPHYLRLYFVKETMVIASWSFGFLLSGSSSSSSSSSSNNKDDDDGDDDDYNQKRTWYLDSQSSSSYVRSEYKLCTDWSGSSSSSSSSSSSTSSSSSSSSSKSSSSNSNDNNSNNIYGVGILEELTLFWSTIQDYYFHDEPKNRIKIKRFCSYPNCSNKRNNNNNNNNRSCYKKCSQCQLSYYCCKDHQAKHWPIHKLFCHHQDQNQSPTITSTSTSLANRQSIEDVTKLYEQLDGENDTDLFVDGFV